MVRHFATLPFLILVTLVLGTPSLLAQFGSDLPPANMEGITAPITDKSTGQYKAILYAKGGEVSNYHLTDVRVDVIKSAVKEPKDIVNIRDSVIYPFGTKDSRVINAFWDAIPHCQAIIESEEVVLHPAEKIVTGEKEVHVYAREADVSGVGFSYDLDSKRLSIHHNVKIIVRQTDSVSLDYK